MCRFWRSWRTETARCFVLVYLGRVRVDIGRVRYLRVVKNISFCDLISVVQVLDLFNIVYNCFSDYLCVEFFICVENSSSNRFRILSYKFLETPIHPPSRRILGPLNWYQSEVSRSSFTACEKRMSTPNDMDPILLQNDGSNFLS